jgi:hypothetical protein
MKKNPTHAKKSCLVGLALAGLSLLGAKGFAQDPDFHIYLAFGQSNMEGNATPEAQDKTGAPARFQVFQAVDCSNLSRQKEKWYPANAPLCRCNTGLTPVDYFGRTLADSLPSNIKIGVINVAVAGCAIEMFDKDKYQSYITGQADWMKSIANEYGGNPYARLVELAKLAQKDGVIKGLLLHQGESGSSTNQWANEVKKIYNDLIQDLSLNASKTPLLAGDLARPSTMVQGLPKTLANSYVISTAGLKDRGDGLHFDAPSYRALGRRYADTMLTLLKKQGEVGVGAPGQPEAFAFSGRMDDRTGAAVSFRIPRAGYVSVKAYTLAGKEIAELAGARYAAGRHALEFGGERTPPGLCILRMKTEGFTATRRVVLGAN